MKVKVKVLVGNKNNVVDLSHNFAPNYAESLCHMDTIRIAEVEIDVPEFDQIPAYVKDAPTTKWPSPRPLLDSEMDSSDPNESRFHFYWKDGQHQTSRGTGPADALNRLGYSAGATTALDFWAKGEESQWQWDTEAREWIPKLNEENTHDRG